MVVAANGDETGLVECVDDKGRIDHNDGDGEVSQGCGALAELWAIKKSTSRAKDRVILGKSC